MIVFKIGGTEHGLVQGVGGNERVGGAALSVQHAYNDLYMVYIIYPYYNLKHSRFDLTSSRTSDGTEAPFTTVLPHPLAIA